MSGSPWPRLLAQRGLACYGAGNKGKGGCMSQPIRVEGWAYVPGARVNLQLQFRSQSTYARVKAQFHNPSGGVFKLEELRTQGRNPGPLTPGSSLRATYPKTLPLALTNADPWRGSPTRGNGCPSSKTRPSTSAWSEDPSTPQVRESSSGSSQPRGREA